MKTKLIFDYLKCHLYICSSVFRKTLHPWMPRYKEKAIPQLRYQEVRLDVVRYSGWAIFLPLNEAGVQIKRY